MRQTSKVMARAQRLGWCAVALLGLLGAGVAHSAPRPTDAISMDSPIEDIVSNPAGRAILERDVPNVINNPNYHEYRGMTLQVVAAMFGPKRLPPDVMAKVFADLATLSAPTAGEDVATQIARLSKLYVGIVPGQIDPRRMLPPPPAEGSARQQAELVELRHIQSTRSTERLAQAKWDDEHEEYGAFAAVLGPRFDLDQLPATRKLLNIVSTDQWVAAALTKLVFARHHPFIADRSLVGCPPGGMKDPGSYPSGHATWGFTVGVVLGDLIPEKSQAILARADDFGYSRLVCSLHYPSDIAASQTLGSALGLQILQSPALRDDVEAARVELRQAGVGGS